MIKSEQDIQWTTSGEVTPGQRAALRNYFDMLTQTEKDALQVVWMEPGRIVGYDASERVVEGFLYDAEDGRLMRPTLENYMMIPMYSEIHFAREGEGCEDAAPMSRELPLDRII